MNGKYVAELVYMYIEHPYITLPDISFTYVYISSIFISTSVES